MSLILILAHAAVLLAPLQQVIPVGPGPDTVQSDRVKTLEVNGQLPQELDWYASIGYRIVEVRGDVLRLERSSNSGDHHDYLVLLRDKKSRTEPRMNDAASRGFLSSRLHVPRGANLHATAVTMNRSLEP